MALVKCSECGHETSTEAKRCPNCGAKNKAYKSQIGKLILLGVLGFIVYIIYFAEPNDEYFTNCETQDKREAFASVIDESSYAQLKKLRVVDITKVNTVKKGSSITDLVCDATIHFNSSDDQRYRFTWRESESGSLLIQASPK